MILAVVSAAYQTAVTAALALVSSIGVVTAEGLADRFAPELVTAGGAVAARLGYRPGPYHRKVRVDT